MMTFANATDETPGPNTAEALRFLQWWRPQGVLTLAAIQPDGPINTQSWSITGKAVWQNIGAWIDHWQGQRNIYFTANETHLVRKKPTKGDVTAIRAAYTDADPDTSAGYVAGRQKLMEELLPQLTSGDMPASVVIDSGNGLQALWRLIDSDGIDQGAVTGFEAINKP
jgi:hypothetical protein